MGANDNKTIIVKDIKWLIGKATLIITILSIIVGIHAKVFKDLEEFKGIDFLNPQKYIDFFDRLGEGQGKTLDIYFDTTIQYSHLIIQDRTMSTLQANEKNKDFAKALFTSLESSFPDLKKDYKITASNTTRQKLLGLKDLYVLKFYEKMLKHESSCYYRILYYDGNDSISDIKSKTNEQVVWKQLSKNNRGDLITLLYSDEFNVSLPDQETDFNFLFGKIKEYCNQPENKNRKTIVSIISDFYHDIKDPIIEDSIKTMQTGKNSPIQFNLVYIVPNDNDNDKQTKSREVVELLKKNICGSQHIIPINSENYIDKNGTKKFKETDILLTQCFSSIGADKKQRVILYYPKESDLNYETAECKIVLNTNSIDTIIKTYHWRITVPYSKKIPEDYFVYYDANNEKSRSHIGHWHTSCIFDTLKLFFPYTDRLNDMQCTLEIVHGNNSKSFLIKYGGTIPANIAEVAKFLVGILMILFVLFVVVKTYELYEDNKTNLPAQSYKKPIKCYINVRIVVVSTVSVIWLFYCSEFKFNFSLVCAIILSMFLILQLLILFSNKFLNFLCRIKIW